MNIRRSKERELDTQRKEKANEDSPNQKVMMKTFITCEIHRRKRSQSRASLHQSCCSSIRNKQANKKAQWSNKIQEWKYSTPHHTKNNQESDEHFNKYFKIKEPEQIYI